MFNVCLQPSDRNVCLLTRALPWISVSCSLEQDLRDNGKNRNEEGVALEIEEIIQFNK